MRADIAAIVAAALIGGNAGVAFAISLDQLPKLEPMAQLPAQSPERDFTLACLRAVERQTGLGPADAGILFRPAFTTAPAGQPTYLGMVPDRDGMTRAYTHVIRLEGDDWATADGEFILCEAFFDPAAPAFPQVVLGGIRGD